jgi:hypothetical protein
MTIPPSDAKLSPNEQAFIKWLIEQALKNAARSK